MTLLTPQVPEVCPETTSTLTLLSQDSCGIFQLREAEVLFPKSQTLLQPGSRDGFA